MKLLHDNSLFAVLLRSPWWASALLALAAFGVVRLLLPPFYAAFAASPFVAIGAYVGWRQLRTPSGARLAAALERARAMPWEEFSAALEAGLRRDGHVVSRAAPPADFELVTKEGRAALVGAKRWKASRVGVEQLRELMEAAEGRDCMVVCLGELSDNAREYAAKHAIRLVRDAELAQLVAPK